MTVFSQATRTNFDRALPDGTRVYNGTLDPFWTVGAVPHGGYLLAVILEAVIHSQSRTNQPDPIHLSAHFLLPSRPEEYEVRIREHRIGRRFSNITADFYQNGQMNITTHIIVGTLVDLSALTVKSADKSTPTILPPHPYAARTPFRQHTSVSLDTRLPPKLSFRSQIRSSDDRTIQERYHAQSKVPEESSGGFNHGGWFEVLGEEKGVRLGLPAMALLADLCRNTPTVLPEDDQPGSSWFPTLTLALEFKVKLSSLPDYMAPHTFGVYSTGRFIHQGRHEVQSEVWTAPSALPDHSAKKDATGAGVVDANWREKMVCVAIASQMALTIPLEVNQRKAKAIAEAKAKEAAAAAKL